MVEHRFSHEHMWVNQRCCLILISMELLRNDLLIKYNDVVSPNNDKVMKSLYVISSLQ